jgi:hypothetical protein
VGDDILGPIDFLAIEFPNGHITADIFDLLMQLTKRGVIQVLDLEFVGKSADGTVQKVELDGSEHDTNLDVSLWQAAESRLLDASDIETIAVGIAPGNVAAIVVYENIWAVPLLSAVDRGQARLIGEGRIAADDVRAALADPSA